MASAERDFRMQEPHDEGIDAIAFTFGLEPDHPLVLAYAAVLREKEFKQSENDYLRLELDNAQRDPMTGFWWRGPGFSRVEDMISTVENNRAGLGDDDGPNAILGIGLDVEALHYTNNWYSQKGGDARVVIASRELREVSGILKDSLRTSERRTKSRGESDSRISDVLTLTGGDEFMAALAVTLSPEETEAAVATTVIERLAERKNQNIPNTRILYRAGFFVPGQNAEDFYHSVDPKAHFSRAEKLSRPIFKIVRLGLGHYRPPLYVNQEL